MRGRYRDLRGEQYGLLTVKERVGTQGNYSLWECVCRCGTTVKLDSKQLLQRGHVSCGECSVRRKAGGVTKHNMSNSPEWGAFKNMRLNYKDQKFTSFEQFLELVGERPSPEHKLKRKDARLPHGPTNTHWKRTLDDTDLKQSDLGERYFLDLSEFSRGGETTPSRATATQGMVGARC